MTTRSIVPAALALAVALAGCGGSSTPSQLAYTDPPTSAKSWRLVKDPDSTSTRLVLALVGPAIKSRGVGFNLKAGPGVRFAAFDDGLPVQDTGVYELKSAVPDPSIPPDIAEPVLLAGGVKSGNVLTVGIFQKDRAVSAKASNVPLLRIALEVAPGTSGAGLALEVQKARMLPEDIGGTTDGIAIVNKSHLDPIEIAVGGLQAK